MEEQNKFRGKMFSSEYQPDRRGKKHSVAWHLSRILCKNIEYEDPATKKIKTGPIAKVIALRLILNACKGDNEAIKEVLDRIDGKNVQKILNEGNSLDTKLVIIRAETKPNIEESSTNKPILDRGLRLDEGKGVPKNEESTEPKPELSLDNQIPPKDVPNIDKSVSNQVPIISISPKG